MKGDDTGQDSVFKAIKVSWSTGMAIVLLTLAVWIFFRLEDLRLDAAATAVVALAVTLLVLLGQWLWSRLRRSGGAK